MSTATEIASIKKLIEDMNARFEIIEQRITKVELAQNDFIKKTKEIKKGIATKVAFDSSGLITNSLSLEAKDIPEISIDKIKNLTDSLETLDRLITENKNTISLLQKSVQMIETARVPEQKTTLSDIPELPISKINNLKIELSKKADHSEVTSFHSLIDLANRSTATQFKHLREELNFKIDYATFTIIENRILHLEELIGNLLQQYPIDKIMDEINALKEKI